MLATIQIASHRVVISLTLEVLLLTSNYWRTDNRNNVLNEAKKNNNPTDHLQILKYHSCILLLWIIR